VKLWIELWVRLKVVDLVAQTAWITLTEKLDFAGRIRGLIHYNYWGFSAEGERDEAIIGEIDRVVRIDGAFTNQNKHCYRLMASAAADDAPGPAAASPGVPGTRAQRRAGTAAPALVRGDLALERDYALRGGHGSDPSDGAPMDRGSAGGAENLFAVDCLVRERLGDREAAFALRLNARLRGVGVAALKCGVVAARGGDDAVASVERMAVTRSRREGLLLNPHYQTVEMLSALPLPVGAARGPEG
jgi:hypothetical protein